MISIFIKILVYDSEMGKDFVNRFFLGELNKVDYYFKKILLLLLLLKVKSDHRSKFSNLSNWKEEA